MWGGGECPASNQIDCWTSLVNSLLPFSPIDTHRAPEAPWPMFAFDSQKTTVPASVL